MERLNLTLDTDTMNRIKKHAEVEGKARAAFARELLVAGLERLERIEKLERLARDYAEGRREVSTLLSDFETGQLELLDD